MLELSNDTLTFSFPDVHPEAKCSISFIRTLRIPDDDKTYPLPPGLGSFPMRHVDEFKDRVPAKWLQHGGVMLPMYQSEAMWLAFRGHSVPYQGVYPFAIKIAAGKRSAVTGKAWSKDLKEKDYCVIPKQPWLDGYVIDGDTIRRMRLCSMDSDTDDRLDYSLNMERGIKPDMALAPGGKMKQTVYEDPYGLSDWDAANNSRCFIHLANSLAWRAITKHDPPTAPRTAADYAMYKLPWFDHYDDGKGLKGTKTLQGLKSVMKMGFQKGFGILPENESVEIKSDQVVKIKAKDGVRDGNWSA